MQFINVITFEDWREQARMLLAANVPPAEIQWSSQAEQPSLFDDHSRAAEIDRTSVVSVPKGFLELARHVACHRDNHRWQLLYRTLWRLTREEKDLLRITTDDDVHALEQMQKAVTRDMHKMKAFVRFRKQASDGVETFIAWHRPDHRIVRLTAPFFARRFRAMNWSILTPDESVRWNQEKLEFGSGVPVSDAPTDDALEELWLTYYASIFNPARIKVASMKNEMPVRHWPTLPETKIIPDLLRLAGDRVDTMIDSTEGFDQTAAHFMPEQKSISSLATAAACCRACDLHAEATQTVFGSGPSDARLVLVGEQPGDREDIEGTPFVGPAGRLLDEALSEAGIQRSEVYITNVVKHFKFIERGKRRLHQKPGSREIFACRPWLEAELATIQPQALVCLGATAAQAMLGRDFRITKRRGEIVTTDWCDRTIATWHPAAILRMPRDERRTAMTRELVADLAAIK